MIRYPLLAQNDFETFFQLIEPLLFKRATTKPDRFILFHASLVEWFTDVKFCTQSYLVNLPEAHFTLMLFYYGEIKRGLGVNATNSGNNWRQFKLHLTNSSPVMSKAQMGYFNLVFDDQSIQMQVDGQKRASDQLITSSDSR